MIHLRRHTLIWLALAVLAMALITWGQGGLRAVITGNRRVPVYRVDTAERKVALSFDACWGATHTPQLLDILDRYGVKATFFLVNIWLEDYPEQARTIAAGGHEIGLHSSSHPQFSRLNREQMVAEIYNNKAMAKEVTGVEAKVFRPPFGDYNNTLIEVCEEQGLVPVQWSVDSLDWKGLAAATIQERVLDKVGPGDIILFHNDGAHTAEALPAIIEGLRQQDLKPVPVSELLLPGETYVDSSGVQHVRGQ